MYAKIVDNQIVELSASDYGSDDYVLVPPEVEGADKIYDTNTNSVRAKTAEEIAAGETRQAFQGSAGHLLGVNEI